MTGGSFKVAYPIAVANETKDGEAETKQEVSRPKTYETVEIDFTPPFKRLPILETLEQFLGEKLPDVNSPGATRSRGCSLERHD